MSDQPKPTINVRNTAVLLGNIAAGVGEGIVAVGGGPALAATAAAVIAVPATVRAIRNRPTRGRRSTSRVTTNRTAGSRAAGGATGRSRAATAPAGASRRAASGTTGRAASAMSGRPGTASTASRSSTGGTPRSKRQQQAATRIQRAKATGRPMSSHQWKRLARIASGAPSRTKRVGLAVGRGFRRMGGWFGIGGQTAAPNTPTAAAANSGTTPKNSPNAKPNGKTNTKSRVGTTVQGVSAATSAPVSLAPAASPSPLSKSPLTPSAARAVAPGLSTIKPGGGSMSSPMQQLTEIAESEMLPVVRRWEPEGVEEILSEFKKWPELQLQIGQLWDAIRAHAEDEFPLRAVVVALLESITAQQKNIANAVEEIPGLIRQIHADDFDRLADRKQRMWDHRANPNTAGTGA